MMVAVEFSGYSLWSVYKVEAQYALESTSQPLGISSYELSKLIPEEFRGSMPTIEEIEAELNE